MARNSLLPLVLLACLGLRVGGDAVGQESVKVINGDFDQWNQGSPVGWTVETGATNGADLPKSEIKQIPGPALMLRGAASTKAWQLVSQTIDASPGETFRLTFSARVKDVRREGRQFDNCHVGWMSKDAAGKLVGRSIVDVSAETSDWKHFEVDHLVPAGATQTIVYAFLSKSGILGVKGVEVSKLGTATPNLLQNHDFQDWRGERPVGWTVEVAANNGGSSPESIVKEAADGGVQLSGNRQTLAWNSVSQEVDLEPGASYELAFKAIASGIKKEGRQFDNCYAGVMHFSTGGKRLGFEVKDLSQFAQVRKDSLTFRVPANCKSTKVIVFLSKSGTLTVKELSLVRSTPLEPFAELIKSMHQQYSFTEMKGINWTELAKEFEGEVDAAATPEAFASVIVPILRRLKDLHVFVELPGGPRIPTHRSSYIPNVDRSIVRENLDSVEDFAGVGFLGKIGEAVLIFVEGLPSDGDYGALTDAIVSMEDVTGYIIDLRLNKGGNESRGAEIAGLFVEEPVLYARSLRRRNGALEEGSPRYLQPSSKRASQVPIVCLIGPGCVSSGEGMALMFKAIEQSVVLGQPTRGASGNPSPVTLSNGLKVWFSRWQSLEADGTPIEDRGVLPDENFESPKLARVTSIAGARSDALIDRGLQIIESSSRKEVTR
ncbi:MAG: S41 family peptidase [Planctomycetota bacterium]